MTDLQHLYGLVVSSEVPLHQDRPADPGAPVDVRVRWGAERSRADQATAVEGAVLLESTWRRRVEYTAVERPDGSLVLRFVGACDVDLSADLRDVVVHPVRGADTGIAAVLVSGAVLAFQLYRRGLAVLHGSAVDLGGAAVAFVGPSGGGKSTMATLMCADGAALVTDDVLRVDDVDVAPVVRLGATGLRLRKGADTLVGLFDGASPGRRLSADRRHVLSPSPAVRDRLPLAAIVLPVPERRLPDLTTERLNGKDALFELLAVPRLLGWRDPAVLQGHLAHLAALVANVPVIRARVPWGPPFDRGIAGRLREVVLADGAQPAEAGPSSETSGR